MPGWTFRMDGPRQDEEATPISSLELNEVYLKRVCFHVACFCLHAIHVYADFEKS